MPSPKMAPAKRKAADLANGDKPSNKHDPSISPPPMKRKVQASVSKTAVASFFTPASQKPKPPPSQVTWEERAPEEGQPTSLLVATFQGGAKLSKPSEPAKIAAFDLDSTLITTSSGKKHAESASDWMWWHRSVPERLRKLHNDEGFTVIIFSNQGGLALHPDPKKKAPAKGNARDKVADYKQKCAAILTDLGLPVTLYAATGKDRFRKPRPGMWDEMMSDLASNSGDKKAVSVDPASFFIGDAAGRPATVVNGKNVVKDFSCSDRNLAHNVGVTFQTPEEYFLDESPREFSRGFDLTEHPFVDAPANKVVFAKGDGQELVVFCGPPGAGKSTFFRKFLEPMGYERVNQDTLKTKEKCLKVASGLLGEGFSVVVDNTNPDPATRALWIDLAKKSGSNIKVRCVWFTTNAATCEHNDAVRAMNKSLNPDNREALPRIAFNGFYSRFREPKVAEGFADITEVAFTFRGTEDEYALWGKYWT